MNSEIRNPKSAFRNRRSFLWQAPAVCIATGTALAGGVAPRCLKVAAIFTVLRFRSHAFNILENMLGPYLFRGERHVPQLEVASLYADQLPEDDMARDVSRRFGVPLYGSIDEALCLGGKDLAVDAVVLIGEHGEYPQNKWGQTLYPRKRFFDQALAVMERSGRFVPLFNDKHLSFRWDWALEMFEASRRHQFPMMAGSSVPLAERRPMIELPAGAELSHAIAIHGGGFESYDFHGLEVLQSFVEARQGGEVGVESVEFLAGEAFERAKGKRWPQDLVDAAVQAEAEIAGPRQQRPAAGVFSAASPAKPQVPPVPVPSAPYAISVTYRDGFRGTVLALGGGGDRWSFACQIRGESKPRATAMFNGPWGNRCLFMALTHAIEHMFVARSEPYPLERTLLTTGALEAAVRSYHEGRPVDTPHLAKSYRAGDWHVFRETGASWRLPAASAPQPAVIDPQRFTSG